MAGYTFEIGGSFMLKQWLALRAAMPLYALRLHLHRGNGDLQQGQRDLLRPEHQRGHLDPLTPRFPGVIPLRGGARATHVAPPTVHGPKPIPTKQRPSRRCSTCQSATPRRPAPLRPGGRRRAEVAPACRGTRRLRLWPGQPRRAQPRGGHRSPDDRGAARGQPALHAFEGHARTTGGHLPLVRAALRPDGSIPIARPSSPSAPRKASRTCCWRWSPRVTSCWPPIPATRFTVLASSSPAATPLPGRLWSRRRSRGGDRARPGQGAAPAGGAARQLPPQPHRGDGRARLLREGRGHRAARKDVGRSPTSPTLTWRSIPRPHAQHLRGPRRSRRGGRVLHGVEELLDAGVAGRVLRRQPDAGRPPGHHQGLPRLRHLRAGAAGRRHGAGQL